MNAKRVSSVIVAVAAVFASWSCSRADELCDLYCECVHCNDEDEDRICEYLNVQQDIAGEYECDAAWESWAECVENNGTCIEESATFTTADVDRCASFVDLQVPCAGDGDCAAQSAFCNNGSCMRRSCNSDPQNLFCNTDNDCPQGPNRCAEVEQALADCEQNASDINISFTGFFGGLSPGQG